MTYKVVIIYDPEYKGYVVDVPQLVGCMSQGKTIDEALTNIKDAIKGWLFVEKKHGRLAYKQRRARKSLWRIGKDSGAHRKI